MRSFAPRLETLPHAQRRIWSELEAVPPGFVLYGGTAVALRLGHRASVDFDFFSSDPLDRRLLGSLPFARDAQVLQDQPDTWTLSVDRGSPIKVSFFGPIGFGRVGEPEITETRVAVASLLDLGATKLKVLLQRVEAKDYLDIAALLQAGVKLADVLRAARCLFGDAFNPLAAQKTLGWFEGGDLSTLDRTTRERLVRASVEDVDLPPLPLASRRLD